MPHGMEDWCKPEFRVTFGSAAEEILIAAKESNANLIVMGAKARKNLAGHVPLTVAYSVVTKAPCPVLTVRGRFFRKGAESLPRDPHPSSKGGAASSPQPSSTAFEFVDSVALVLRPRSLQTSIRATNVSSRTARFDRGNRLTGPL